MLPALNHTATGRCVVLAVLGRTGWNPENHRDVNEHGFERKLLRDLKAAHKAMKSHI